MEYLFNHVHEENRKSLSSLFIQEMKKSNIIIISIRLLLLTSNIHKSSQESVCIYILEIKKNKGCCEFKLPLM